MEAILNYMIAPGVKETISSLIRQSRDRYGISYEEMQSKSRKDRVVEARMYAMYLIRKNFDYSLREIGLLFNRDHATVIHACKTIETRIELNQLLV